MGPCRAGSIPAGETEPISNEGGFLSKTKVCTKCHKRKIIEEFNLVHPAKKNGRIRPDCKQCCRDRAKSHPKSKKEYKRMSDEARRKAREFSDNYLSSHPCVDCGETDPVVLDYDHVRGIKIMDVSMMVGRGYRIWRIEDEIAKCDIRCANDHRRVTAKRRLLTAGVV